MFLFSYFELCCLGVICSLGWSSHNIRGVRNGIQALIKKWLTTAPLSTVFPLFPHSLSLCVQDVTIKEVQTTAQLYGVHFLAGSAHLVFTKETKTLWKCAQGYHLARRWVYSCLHCSGPSAQHEGLFATLPSTTSWRTTRPSYPCLKEVIQQGHDEYAAKAKGLLMQMETFDTFFSLKLAYLIFSAMKQFSTNLQAKETTVEERTRCSSP